MGLKISIDRSLTFRQLQALQQAGYPVFKTPHVGNVHHNNIVCARLGIRLILCDTLTGTTDKRFRPHGVMRAGTFEPLASSDKPATLVRVEQSSNLVNGIAVGDLLADLHVATLRAVCPNATILTDGEYLRMHKETVETVCDVVLETHAKLWRRFVREDGSIENMQRQVFAHEIRGNLFRVHKPLSGWFMPLPVRILLDGVCEALETGKDTIYSLSGPDMHSYIQEGSYAPLIAQLYEKVRQSNKLPGLPEHLNLVIVPVQEARFAGPMRERAAIEFLVAALKNLQAAAALCPSALYPSGTADHAMTQYDLAAGEELFIHPDIMDVPMETFEKLFALLT